MPEPRQLIRMNVIEQAQEHFESRGVFMIDEEVNQQLFSALTLDLLIQDQKINKQKAFWIILNCLGGDVYQGLAIYDLIHSLVLKGRTVNMLCMGEVASMASCILQAGSRRYSTSSTQFLIHEVSRRLNDEREKASQGEERVEEHKRINRIVLNLISEKIGMPPEQLFELVKGRDYCLDAQSALKLGRNGLIDEVVEKLPFEL